MKSDFFANFTKGVAIGSSMLIPGVSGGTMAIILGSYDRLIRAVSTIWQNKRRNGIFLLQYLAGGITGMILFSGILLHAVNSHRMVMMYLFLGAIAGSLPMLYGKARIKKPSVSDFILMLSGYLTVLLISMLPREYMGVGNVTGFTGILLIFVSGLIIAVALILPGISASHMLLMLGLYDATLNAVSEINILFLLPLGLSVLVGVLLTSRALEKFMSANPRAAYLIIIGFVAGSLYDVFPGLPAGTDILYCIMTFAVGLTAILFLSKFSD